MWSMFEELRTDRLLLRRARTTDVDALHARRNDPATASLQAWPLPYPRERAEALVAASIDADPIDGSPIVVVIADHDDASVLGDIVLVPESQGRLVEVGYGLQPDARGVGFATEALEAVVGFLFDQPDVARVFGQLHPDNLASASVLERCGFVFEGHLRNSFWVGDVNSDDWYYGMTRDDWLAWRDRPTSPPTQVDFVEIGEHNQYATRRLSVHHTQERLVAPVVASMADALFPEVIDGAAVVPWMRAVEADGELAAFVMIAETTEAHPEPYLWRLLVDRRHQRRGIGQRVIELLVAHLRAGGDTSLLTSWVPGPGSPERFYASLGFVPTGNIEDGEIEARLRFDASD